MRSYHCLDCAGKLKEISVGEWEWADEYECSGCETKWYRTERGIITWIGCKKKESEVKHDA